MPSTTQALIKDAKAQAPSLNPCARCVKQYTSLDVGEWDKLCRFPTNKSLNKNLHKSDKFVACGCCLNKHENCYEMHPDDEDDRKDLAAALRALHAAIAVSPVPANMPQLVLNVRKAAKTCATLLSGHTPEAKELWAHSGSDTFKETKIRLQGRQKKRPAPGGSRGEDMSDDDDDESFAGGSSVTNTTPKRNRRSGVFADIGAGQEKAAEARLSLVEAHQKEVRGLKAQLKKYEDLWKALVGNMRLVEPLGRSSQAKKDAYTAMTTAMTAIDAQWEEDELYQ